MGMVYEQLAHADRAALSAYLQRLREAAGLSQMQLADKIAEHYVDLGIDQRRIAFYENHPAGPMSRELSRRRLAAIGRVLARLVERDECEVLLEINRLGGGAV